MGFGAVNQVQLWAETKLGWRSENQGWVPSKAKNDGNPQLLGIAGPSSRFLIHCSALLTGVLHCVTEKELETKLFL